MGSSIFWRPVDVTTPALPYELKKILEAHWGMPISIDRSESAYLRGLRDAGIKGADTLLKALEKHGRLEVFLQW